MTDMSEDTVSPASNTLASQSRCFPHHHMSATEYAIYDVCRALALGNDRGNGTLYFSGPKIAERFRSMSKNTPYGVAKSLLEAGWFKLLKKPTRRSNGTLSPTHYKVLSHEEWASEHPRCCFDPSRVEVMAQSQLEGMERSPFPPNASPFPSGGAPFPPSGSPSHGKGSNLYKQLIQTTNKITDISSLTPSQLEGMAFIERFSKRKKRKTGKAEATHTETRPFPQTGTVVSNTPAPKVREPKAASLVAKATMANLGFATYEANWELHVLRLLNKGYSGQTIEAVAKFYHETCGDDIVRRERGKGFEDAFPRLMNEMNATLEQKRKEAA
ncbi:hypothetical protein [Granulicella sp. L46]|uniref:hypothetical protein n=1 Tax=Granulicella sp. L46 TaxID=1641865 RepID=UPI00131A7A7B|nr:hypothetical protein [Granulicella sp. L46]